MKTENNSLSQKKLRKYFKEKTKYQLAHILWYLNYNKNKVCEFLAFYGYFNFFGKDFYEIIDENRDVICEKIISDLLAEDLIF